MSTRMKLWVGFGLVTALLSISCVIVLFNVRTISREVVGMADARTRVTSIRELHLGVLKYSLDVNTTLQTQSAATLTEASQNALLVEERLQRHGTLPLTDRQRELTDRFASQWASLRSAGELLLAAARDGRVASTTQYASFDAMSRKVDSLLESEMRAEALSTYDVHSTSASTNIRIVQNVVLLLLIAGTLAGGVIAVTVSRTIVRNEAEILSQAEWLRVTLTSIGDGVVTTDAKGRVTFLNPVAQTLTGWTRSQAMEGADGAGLPVERVFNIVNETTRQRVENPVQRALRDGVVVGLANHTVLIRKDGKELPIDDSGAPIRNAKGEIAGAVLVFRDVTEHKRQEKLVKNAFEYASNILDTQREPFLVLDKDLRVMSANNSFYKFFQVEQGTTVGRLVYELGDGQWNIPRLREMLGEVLPKKCAFDGFGVTRDFPGGVGEKIMMVSARVMRKLGDDSDLILLSIQDVTDRERALRGLHESEERYRTLFESIDEGFCVIQVLFDDTGKPVDYVFNQVNPAFEKQTGIADAVGRRIREIAPDLEDFWFETYGRIALTGEPQRFQNYAAALGRWYEGYAFRIGGPANRCVGVLFNDVTDRKSALLDLHESEVRYRRLFETAKDGILILDAHTRKITDANAFMCGLTGLESHDLLGKELFEIGMYKDIEENKQAFRELQRTGYLRHDHLPVKQPGGEEVPVEFVANIYREGTRLVAQCNVRDISERSRLEKEIIEQSKSLAAQSKGKDEFLAMLSHELRNPLAPIRAAVQLLRTHETPDAVPVQRQAREIIERQVANLTRMVSDLLEVSRVVTGRILLDLKPIDIKQVVRHAVHTTATLFEQRSHLVEVNLCDEPVWAMADATRLEEVLVNLLNNAAKYTPDGGRIIVTCERGPERAAICVIDNGVGIDKELLPRIFDLFTQADRSLARSAGGLGIGLSLAHRLVGQHGGTIEAKSEGPGKGSQFIVKLPLIEQPDAAAHGDEPAKPIEQPRPEGVVRVLVVDDNVDLVTMLASILRRKGYIVRSAHNGPDGLLIAQQWQPDITLLDIGLPGLDGYEVARRLRAEERADAQGAKPRTRLLALTGYGRDADVALALEAGFDAHLVKPCDLDELDRLMSAPLNPGTPRPEDPEGARV